ncbi:UDP-N-acetylglucosamine 2-epimerase [candidate division TA06 bacterium DG_78]|uniref:UDP-N-acetylglucosamine 2-epimerase n=1 Tax=candidate division TA06 bacterium DG_78 TaxID=1703772 RepID=A0A0S7Y897_UNCT6|nr:MAG: UDP-N-acetylglucosamine 2-epimerase [candidate division TA06 bacterium DG_78]
MKISSVYKELKKIHRFRPIIVHTGQHYDVDMSDIFFRQLQLPKPDIFLGIGSGTHGEQTGKLMIAFERICAKENPDLVIVVGDVNSTVGCALVAAKMNTRVAHVEAGMRSFDRTMPEEINRVLTDHIADFLFTTCEDANSNLRREGIPKHKIFFTGNVMIDTLLQYRKCAQQSKILTTLQFKKNNKIQKYAVVTLHRPSNVDDPVTLRRILYALNAIAKKVPVVFPMHPRTIKNIERYKLGRTVHYISKVPLPQLVWKESPLLAIPPLGYLDFLNLISHATLVLTDSGGIQEETTILRIPCLTIRSNTERPITIKEGTNLLVGSDRDQIVKTAFKVLRQGVVRKRRPRYWDGRAAQRITKILLEKL